MCVLSWTKFTKVNFTIVVDHNLWNYGICCFWNRTCNNVKVFKVIFDKFNVSLLKKSINSLKKNVFTSRFSNGGASNPAAFVLQTWMKTQIMWLEESHTTVLLSTQILIFTQAVFKWISNRQNSFWITFERAQTKSWVKTRISYLFAFLHFFYLTWSSKQTLRKHLEDYKNWLATTLHSEIKSTQVVTGAVPFEKVHFCTY